MESLFRHMQNWHSAAHAPLRQSITQRVWTRVFWGQDGATSLFFRRLSTSSSSFLRVDSLGFMEQVSGHLWRWGSGEEQTLFVAVFTGLLAITVRRTSHRDSRENCVAQTPETATGVSGGHGARALSRAAPDCSSVRVDATILRPTDAVGGVQAPVWTCSHAEDPVESGVLGSPGARASAGRARGRAGADAKNGLRLARLCLWTSATVASTNLARKNLVMCVSLAQNACAAARPNQRHVPVMHQL
ncbi:uncharacterized protein LOC112567750 [Pomacea canaliculata]|uniref:uncharacterized protein LOC112567750 n=1 Tax=Pomacea canaliculata TaxID=400727 RepID=UPI000D73EF86|nr:uncharacterized protein LOC112567750 [Pomacea canaliculata]